MSERAAEHGGFEIERAYAATPAQVFAAWSDGEAKARWWGGGAAIELDFREGGSERLAAAAGADRYAYAARYHDIVPDERIVYSYEMHKNDERMSVSVVSVTLAAQEGGTLLRYTEQGVFLDRLDTFAAREHGTAEMLTKLGTVLERSGASA